MIEMQGEMRSPKKTGSLLDILLLLRMELWSSPEGCPMAGLVKCQNALMTAWEARCPTVFCDAMMDIDIETWICSAFTHANAGRSANAALDLKRAYLLICCVMANKQSVENRRQRPIPFRAFTDH